MRFAKLFMPLFAVMLVCSSAAFAAEEPVLAVDGRGSASIAPDQAVVTVGVVSRARSASQAQAENAQKSIAITQALKQLGVAGSDIKSRNFSFRPDYRTDDRSHTISGYTASHYLQINVRDIAKAGKIVDTALQSGANEVHSLNFSVSNQSVVRKEALGKAIKDARNKADIIAEGLGCRIIGIKSVSESTGSIEARSYNMNMLAAAKAVDTNFEPGMLTLDANVHIEYLLSR